MKQLHTIGLMRTPSGSTMEEINTAALCALLENSVIVESLDIGTALIHKLIHPAHGRISVINSTADQHAVIFS